MRDGTLITEPGADHGVQTYDAWLQAASTSSDI